MKQERRKRSAHIENPVRREIALSDNLARAKHVVKRESRSEEKLFRQLEINTWADVNPELYGRDRRGRSELIARFVEAETEDEVRNHFVVPSEVGPQTCLQSCH